MSAMSDYLEAAFLNQWLRATATSAPATVYVALFTTNPGDGGTGTEVSGGSYSRKTATFAAPSGGVVASNAAVTFNQATASWGTVGWFGIYDAASAGNLLFHGALTTAKTIDTGDVFQIPSGSLTVAAQ